MENLKKVLYMKFKIIIIVTILITVISIIEPKYNIFIKMNISSNNIKIFYTIIGLMTIWIGTQRQTYLPFLGECVLPKKLISNEVNNNVIGENLIKLEIESQQCVRSLYRIILHDSKKI